MTKTSFEPDLSRVLSTKPRFVTGDIDLGPGTWLTLTAVDNDGELELELSTAYWNAEDLRRLARTAEALADKVDEIANS